MNRKQSITTLAAIAILVILTSSLFLGVFNVNNAGAISPASITSDNVTVSGVLATDSYVLFPWIKENLTIGFSKYGEMIDSSTKTGLNYNGETDPFAPFAGVPEYQWVEGWVLNITYNSVDGYRNIWALALHSDYYNTSSIGGNWTEGVTGGSSNVAFLGGRKTNGGAVTDPIKVLYDGPRRFVALCKTTIYTSPVHDIALVTVTFTIVFDKVTKQVIVLKDLKRIDYGKNYGDMQVEFGDRGEWDLGPAPAPNQAPLSYAHIFENLSTVYNGDYQSWYDNATGNFYGTYDVAQIIDSGLSYVGYAAFWPKPISTYVAATEGTGHITRDQILGTISTVTEDHTSTGGASFTTSQVPCAYPQSNSTGIFWEADPMVFVDGVQFSTNGTTSPLLNQAYYFEGNHTVMFLQGYVPSSGAVVRLVYKVHHYQDDMAIATGSPFVIGEWAFKMSMPGQMFRGVTAYGLTDLNDGSDTGTLKLDSEVEYYLNATFNPFDLLTAVEKDDFRWVQFLSGDGETTNFALKWNVTTDGTPLYAEPWDEYFNSQQERAERVLVGGVLQVPTDRTAELDYFTPTTYGYTSGIGHNATANYWWINFTTAPPLGTNNIKVLYSTEGPAYLLYYGTDNSENVQENGQYEWGIVGTPSNVVDSEGLGYVTEAFDSIKNIDVLKVGTDFNNTLYGANTPYVMSYLGTGTTATGTRTDYIDPCTGRPSLKDDWCTKIPVASSDMIFVGGLTANLGTEYFNEFTNAFVPRASGPGQGAGTVGLYYAKDDIGQVNKIFALTCWGRNSYISNSTVGYGVISVNEDLNGTVGLTLWGYNGPDTYYVTQWFWNYPYGIPTPDGYIKYSGIQYLQHENPGVTDIILQINYKTHTSTIGGHTYSFDATHPEITIAHNERLGTISEKGQHDP